MIMSYSERKLSGTEESGGLVGNNEEPLLSNYWDELVTGLDKGIGSGSDNGINGLTTGQMTNTNAYIQVYRIDFQDTWQPTIGYPVLVWQDPEDAVDPPEVPIIMFGPEAEKHYYCKVRTDSFKTHEFVFTNSGNMEMLGRALLTDMDSDGFENIRSGGDYTLPPDSSQIIEVVFSLESEGLYQAVLKFSHNALNRDRPIEVELSVAGKTSPSSPRNEVIPERLKLNQNYPNHFNPSTQIQYFLPKWVHVTVEVFNITGRHVATLLDWMMPAGEHATDFEAAGLSSGLYMYRNQVGDVIRTRRMTFVK